MNIWFISKYASPPKYSKMPSRLFHIAYEAKLLGHDILFITSDSNHFSDFPKSPKIYNYEILNDISVIWIKTFKYVKTASAKRIISWLDFEYKLFKMGIKNFKKPDVIHVSSLSIFTILYGYYLKRKYKAKLVFEIRDIWPLTMTEEGGFKKWHPLVIIIGWIERFGYKKSDLIIGTMPNLGEHVKNVLGYDRPFLCLPLGFNPVDYDVKNLEEENPFNIYKNPNKTLIGYAGSMGVTNALESFIETIKILKENDKIHFLLVGSGDLKNKYKEELNECKNVTFLDRIEQNNVKYFLEVCDILYLSTKKSKVWDYGQSMNKVVEYMLASKPIIASYTGYPSMINEAECGYYVNQEPKELTQIILQLSELPKNDLEEIGRRGRMWILKYRKYNLLVSNYLKKLNEFH